MCICGKGSSCKRHSRLQRPRAGMPLAQENWDWNDVGSGKEMLQQKKQ